MRQAGTAVAALALILGAAPNLFAQDARVEVKVVVPGDVIRQVHRIVETTVGPQVRAEITQVMREAVVELSSMGLDLAEIGREISREVSREVQRGRTERDQDRRIEQVDTQTTKIALGPTGSFDLKNLSGEIIVTAGNGREVVMEITKRSRARTEAEAKLGLEQVKVEVDHRGDRATVETRYPDQQGRERTPYSVSVYYNITAPAGTRMNLTSISGDVTVKGMRGDLAVDVVSGDIQISNATRLTNIKSISGETTLTDIESATDLNIGAVSGDLTLLRVKVRRLSVNVISGDVSGTDISAESVELMSMSGSVEYAGPIAAKGRYQLQAHSGDVRFVIGGNVGFDLRAETYSGRIRSDASIEIKGATSSARSLRGTVGDGSAVVVATTFSGNVFLSRR
jgi:putative adhesin